MCFIDFHGMKPPSAIGSSGFTASSGEKCIWKPRPPQSGQAPAGALNEKSRGSMSGRLISQTGQTYFSVSSLSGIPSETSSTKPSESLSAISTASLRRRRFVLAHLHAVDEALYRVAALFVELYRLFEPVERAVDARAHIALLVQFQQAGSCIHLFCP